MAGQAVVHWKPIHDQIVAFRIMGYNNLEIAEFTGYNKDHISDILNDPRALKAVSEAQGRIRKEMMNGIGDRLVGLAQVGVRGLEKTVRGDFEAGTRAKAHQDNVTFGLLDRIGYGKKTEITTKGSNGIQLSRDTEERLVSALEKANEVSEIHEMPEEAIIDVPYDSHNGGERVNGRPPEPTD